MSEFLTRAEAAKHIAARGLPITKLSLQKLASTGGGPAYHVWGSRAVYEREVLDRWVVTKLGAARASTSEAAA